MSAYFRDISTHAPLARCDTHSAQVAADGQHFNSRTSCEVRLFCRPHIRLAYPISTHAPLARCDAGGNCFSRRHKFQLTHLLRGATIFRSKNAFRRQFQLTHLLRGATPDFVFYKHPFKFQLTHLLRGATVHLAKKRREQIISTHAPLARCDAVNTCDQRVARISTHAPLARCDHVPGRHAAQLFHISTHAPLARCDRWRRDWERHKCISTHAPLARCDDALFLDDHLHPNISTHAPLARCDVSPKSGTMVFVKFQLTHLLRGATARHRSR